MDAHNQWEVRCKFNGYCKRVIKNAAINAHRDLKHRRRLEIPFCALTPRQECQLCTYDDYFTSERTEQYYSMESKEISLQMLDDALFTLQTEKRMAVQLYYWEDMTDAEIAEQYHISRTAIRYRRISACKQIKEYLERVVHDSEQ